MAVKELKALQCQRFARVFPAKALNTAEAVVHWENNPQ